MRADTAAGFFNAGLKRERIALTAKAKLISKLNKQLETDPHLIEIITFAHKALETEEGAYRWLAREHSLLEGKSPIEMMLAGHGDRVMRLLANIEYGLPV